MANSFRGHVNIPNFVSEMPLLYKIKINRAETTCSLLGVLPIFIFAPMSVISINKGFNSGRRRE